MKRIKSNEIAELEQQLENSLLKETTVEIIKGIIAGQMFLLDLIVKLILNSGYQRTKIIRELTKIVEIDPEERNTDKPLSDTSLEENEQNLTAIEDSSEEKKDKENASEENNEVNEESKKGTTSKNQDNSPKKKRSKRSNNEFCPVASHVFFHENLEPGDKCSKCLQGRVYPFREKIIPILVGRSPFAYETYRLQTLRCNACGAIFEPKLPKEIPVVGNSTPSAQSMLILLHYKIGVPFASITILQKMFYQNISPAQIWQAIEQATSILEPVYYELRKKAANSQLFYTDDTSLRVLSYYSINKENRESRKRKKIPEDRVGSYSSLVIGCTSDSHEIYLFHHGRKYAGENLKDLLISRDNSLKEPIQMKDASTMNIPANTKVIEAKCNVHAIRKFKDLKIIYPRWCEEVLKRYKKISDIDQMLIQKKADDKFRLAYHKKHSLPLMEEIKNYSTKLIKEKKVEPNSSFGSAVAYFCNHYEELTAFCSIEGAPFDNNKSERGLKMVIRLRKNSMFYKTEHGAEVAGVLHSVLYTAQEAGINVVNYLQTILENPDEVRKNPKAFLPWNFCSQVEEEQLLRAI